MHAQSLVPASAIPGPHRVYNTAGGLLGDPATLSAACSCIPGDRGLTTHPVARAD
jgi:hypothetical protein